MRDTIGAGRRSGAYECKLVCASMTPEFFVWMKRSDARNELARISTFPWRPHLVQG
jgi:hypothetical protein